MTETKKLKKNKLYLLELEYTYKSDGRKCTSHGYLFGYVVGKEDDFFFGAYMERYRGKVTGGDTMHLDLKQFGEWVKSIKEIA